MRTLGIALFAALVFMMAPSRSQAQGAWTPAYVGYNSGCSTTNGVASCTSAFAACQAFAAHNNGYIQSMTRAYTFANEPYTCVSIGNQYAPTPLFVSCPTGYVIDPDTPGGCSLANNVMPGKLIGKGKICIPNWAMNPQPCHAQAEVDSTGDESVGEPINVASGNVYYAVTDYETSGPNVLKFTRYYNSRGFGFRWLAANWRSNFDTTLVVTNNNTQVVVTRPTGQALTFTDVSGVWTPDTDVDVTLGQSNTTWTLTDEDDTAWVYTGSTSNPILTSITARNGYQQTLTYNGLLLTKVTDSYSRSFTFTYNGDGTLQTLGTPDGTSIAYGYTASPGAKNLTSVTFPTSPSTAVTYLYASSTLYNALTGVNDENNNQFLTWTYDGYGRGLSSQVGNGPTADITSVSYNDTSGARTVTNALGVSNTYSFASLQGVPKITKISRAATSTTAAASRTFTYDGNGYLASSTDWNGNSRTFANNSHGLPTTVNEAVGSSPSVARTTSIAYDPVWTRLPETITTPGLTVTINYDASGNTHTRTLTDTTTTTVPYSTHGQARIWTYTFDATGEPRSVQNPRGNTTNFTFANGALTQITDALAHSTNVPSYTVGGRPLIVQDANGVTTTINYDQRQRPLTSALSTAAGTLTTSWSYKTNGNVTTTLPDGSFLTRLLDSAHRVLGYADNYNDQKDWTLDASGSSTSNTFLDPSSTITYWRKYVNDALGRRLQDKSQTTGAAYVYTYDNDGNMLTVTDPLSHASTQAYDALDRLKSSTDANAGIFTASYDAHDRPLSIKDKDGNTTGFVYDGFGDVIQRASPDSGTTVFHYDADGDLTSKTDGASVVTNYSFDALDRLLTRTYPADATLNVAFTYDQAGHGKGIGRLTSLTDAAGSLSRTYDERGNVITTARVNGSKTYTTGYSFDGASRVATITYPSGSLVSYTRDAIGRVTSVATKAPGANSTTLASGITYEPYGPVTATTAFNGEKEAFTFDKDYRMLTLTTTASNGSQHQTFTYDNADNLKTLTDTVCTSCSATYGYDVVNRLTSASSWYGAYAYTLDKNGNFLTNNELTAATYSYVAGTNRISSILLGNTSYPASYNGNGNMTTFTRYPGETTTLTYNKANQLATSVMGSGSAASYGYDAFRQRFNKTDNGSPATLYFYDQSGNTLEEIDGGTYYDYVLLDGRVIGTLTPSTNTLAFVHGDKLGSPVDSTDKNGMLSQYFSYSPYANTSAPYTQGGAQTITQNNRYPGQLFDPETLMNHNGYRDFSTSLGRYVQADPIGLGGGLNDYAYVRGRPLVATDPFGLADFMGVPPGLTSPPASAFPTTGFTRPPNVAVGGSFSISTIAPMSNGGGVNGYNAECTLYQGCNLYRMYPADSSSFGFNPGWSVQCNAAIGGANDDWSGVFNEYQVTVGKYGGGYFTVPEGQGDWQGLSFGIGGGTKIGASATQIVYKPIF